MSKFIHGKHFTYLSTLFCTELTFTIPTSITVLWKAKAQNLFPLGD